MLSQFAFPATFRGEECGTEPHTMAIQLWKCNKTGNCAFENKTYKIATGVLWSLSSLLQNWNKNKIKIGI